MSKPTKQLAPFYFLTFLLAITGISVGLESYANTLHIWWLVLMLNILALTGLIFVLYWCLKFMKEIVS